jgi:GNAT superfamily N-acetyltransferase
MLVGMFVDRERRGTGVGGALIEAVATWAQARGATSLYLWVTSTNTPAIALYERRGFVRTAESQPLPHSPSLLEVLMVRALRST